MDTKKKELVGDFHNRVEVRLSHPGKTRESYEIDGVRVVPFQQGLEFAGRAGALPTRPPTPAPSPPGVTYLSCVLIDLDCDLLLLTCAGWYFRFVGETSVGLKRW
ncbi:hypothetical protein AB0926_30360 [Streptomyces griseoincarnatus]